ncbi:MaoC family dehydratase [Mangrovicoccus ximenensis]|uniref:MaoC family dehydratase n=1 Tax=Mangrovicoccus ximenensis TaxID=1911570 RepID=UPI0013750C08|nr:MaoC family dehydratase [Mangrovicoccus ximenensis]
MLDLHKLSAYKIPDTEMTVTRRDTVLYNLSVGLGADPVDEAQLRFLRPGDLSAVPSMATMIAMPYAWIRKADAGFSGKSVHAGIRFRLHEPLPPEGSFVSVNAVGEILDKGPGKAAIVSNERRIHDKATGRLLVSIRSTNMFRGDGGFGGPGQPAEPPVELPDRSPDAVHEMPTLPQQGLLYQLNGDWNPLHNDPETARSQGFPRPILHGLCTYGITCHALLRHLCGYDPARIRMMTANFTRPVYPGETLAVRIWHAPGGVFFQTAVPARGETVLDRGFAEIGG